MKKLLIINLLLASSLMAYSQAPAEESLGLGWGVGNLQRQDLTVSKFIHKKWSPLNVSIAYDRSQRLVQQADISFSFFNPSIIEPYSYNSFYNGEEVDLAHSFKLIRIEYALGKTVLQASKWRLDMGGKSNNQIFASDYNFGPSGPSPMYISFGLDLWLGLRFDLNEKQYFTSNLSLPLLSHIYRAPYLAQDDQFFENLYSHNGIKEFTNRIADGQLQSWGTSQRFDFDIYYGYKLGGQWDVGMSYLLSMNFNQQPTYFAQIQNTISVSGKYKF